MRRHYRTVRGRQVDLAAHVQPADRSDQRPRPVGPPSKAAGCAMIFQQFNLVGRLDVLTNVLMGRLAHTPAWRSLPKLWSEEDRTMAMAALDQFGLARFAAERAENLSGGQQQRVAICRALLQEPEIVLADEPVASLDPENTRVVMDALQRINRHYGVTIVCNLHAQSWRTQYPELVYAVVPAENATGVVDRFTPFVDYLSRELGSKVTLRVANDYAAVIEGQRAGNIHIAYYGPASFSRPRLTGVDS